MSPACHDDSFYTWLTEALAAGQIVAAPGLVELARLRVTTLPCLGKSASRTSEVFTYLQAVRHTSCKRVEPGASHEAPLQRLVSHHDL